MQTDFVVLARNQSLGRQVAAAMAKARGLSGMSVEKFGRRLGLAPELVDLIEAGEARVDAILLIHAAQIANQPVSSLLGELDLYKLTMPELERQMNRLLAPQVLTIGPQFGR